MRVRYLLWGIFIGALAVQPVSRPAAAGAEPAEPAGPAPLAVVMSCSGEVTVIRHDGAATRVSFGMPLAAGDEVRTGKGASADILFENGNYVSIGPESRMTVRGSKVKESSSDKPMGDNGFQVAQSFLKLSSPEGSNSIAALRGPGERQGQLRAVSPCQTRIAEEHPTFVWDAAEGDEELELTVYDESGVLWKRTVKGVTKLSYPDDAPALVPGPSYSWKLESADPLRYPPLSSQAAYFEIIPEDERADLETTLDRIDHDGSLSPASRHVMRASVYFNHGLLADAVAETEAAVEFSPDDDSLQSILARLYSQVGRTAEAAALYDKILDKE